MTSEIIKRPILDEETIARYRENEQVMNQFIMRPLSRYEDRLTCLGWMNAPESILKRNAMLKIRFLSNVVTRELKYGFQQDSNVIIFITGPMGEGKSTIAKSLAINLRHYAKELAGFKSRIYITFDNDETLRFVEKMKRGDILIQDEIARQMGMDSQTVLNSIFNIQEQIRLAQLSFIFVSPTEKSMINACNMIIEAWGMDKKAQINRFRVKSGYTGKYLGWGTIPVVKDPKIEYYYNKRKGEHVAKLQRLKGGSSAKWDYDELETLAKRLIKKVKEKFGSNFKSTQGFFRTMLSCGLVEHAGSGAKQEAIARLANELYKMKQEEEKAKKDELVKLAKKGQLSTKMDKLGIIRKSKRKNYLFELINTEENPEIPKIMLTYVDQVKKERKFKKLRDHHLEAWMMFHLEGIQASGIAKNFKRTRACILNNYRAGGWFAIVDTEIAGYLAEYAVRDVYYPNLTVYSGNENPDLCDDLDKPTIMVEIKKRDEKKAPVVDMLSTKEIEFIISGGEGRLVIVVMTCGKTVVEQYKVNIKK